MATIQPFCHHLFLVTVLISIMMIVDSNLIFSTIVMGKISSSLSTINRQMILHHQLNYSPYDTTLCRTIPGLTRSQLDVCFRQPDTVSVALQGLTTAINECQYQFANHRWNCSSLINRAQNPYISKFFQKGFRETAFAYAISAAGIAVAVARACSQGSLVNCGCDNRKYKIKNMKTITPSTTWKWGGCSHNLHYAIKFSKLFIDIRENSDMHSLINLHNNQVGRLVVSQNMQVKCKCHGMSGSCELKTCWRSAPDFRTIGRILKERYKNAVLVDQSNLGNKNNQKKFYIVKEKKRKQRQQWVATTKRYKRDLAYDLLYYQKSPDFCEPNQNLDIIGTSGRYCNSSNIGPEGCSSLCCGRGYNLVRQRRMERCNCKFHWCCNVECQICNSEEWIPKCV